MKTKKISFETQKMMKDLENIKKVLIKDEKGIYLINFLF